MATEQMELAKALYAKPQPSAETANAEKRLKLRDIADDRQRQLMVAMWHRMGAFFGAAWESQYGTVKDQTIHAWQGALADFTVGELAGAIKQCEAWDGKFPPTFPEFRALCMAARGKLRPNFTDERVERERQAGKSTAMLEHLARSANSEVAKRELDRMRRIVAGEEVETFEQSFHNCGLGKRWPGIVA